MSIFLDFFGWIGKLDSFVMVPLAIFIISLIVRIKISTALKSAVLVGIGLIGLSAMVDIFAKGVMPATQSIIQNWGGTLSVVDAGVFTLLNVVWGSAIAVFFIPVGLGVNILMLITNTTKTLDVDILNYWVWGISAVVVYAMTESILLGLLAFAINEIIIIKIADWTGPKVQEHFKLPGISIPHGNAALWPSIGIVVGKILDHIPGINKINLNPETIKEKIGLYGEPLSLGLIIGAILGLLGKLPLKGILATAFSVSAVMVLFPKMIAVLMEGLIPISESVRDWMSSRFKRDVYIGLDAAVLIGFPSVLVTGILLIPIVLGLALILPGNKVLPVADLAIATPFLVSMCMPFLKKGNIFYGIIAGIVIFTISLYVAGDLAPQFTKAGQMMG
ncbi:PTS galactitol transporter subunit IIC, partial [candidate division WOR-3 bacterium]|nr:PTS galactitol transporter subunit IIC [candidate division WOR-3 bacterium]